MIIVRSRPLSFSESTLQRYEQWLSLLERESCQHTEAIDKWLVILELYNELADSVGKPRYTGGLA